MSEKQMRIRGPKGTTKGSRIVVHVTGNPKTLDDPTRDYWELYEMCSTMGELIKTMHEWGVRGKALKMMTLDARRGYISLEGYDKNRVPFDSPKSPELRRVLEKHMPPECLADDYVHCTGHVDYKQDCTEGDAVAPVAP